MQIQTKKDTTYNGWKNRQTWNVSLWISNDEPLYRCACDFMRKRKDSGKPIRGSYSAFIRYMGMQSERTPDNIKWLGQRLDYPRLSEMMAELIDWTS